jgi:hypothetical protein
VIQQPEHKNAPAAQPKIFADLNISRRCSSALGHIVLFLIIPGFTNVPEGCAMLIGRLLQETIERDLESKNLLSIESRSSKSIRGALQKQTVACLRDMAAKGMEQECAASAMKAVHGNEASRRFIEDVAERVYGDSLLSFVRHDDQFYFAFSVSDFKAAQRAVKAEIMRLGFLELAEISRYETGSKICRGFHPVKTATPLTLHCIEVLKRAGLLPA